MANNYLRFSEVLEFTGEEGISSAEKSWWDRVGKVREAEDTEAELRALGIDPCSIDELSTEFFPDFRYQVDNTGVWIYAEESGNVEDVAVVVQSFLRIFHPQRVWSMEWATYCDRSRVGEFGGGVLVVTATKADIETTYDIRRRLLSAEGR